MQRIDGPDVVLSLPAPPGPANEPGYFGGGDPARGRLATVITAHWLNMVQEEIMTVVETAGISPDRDSFTQLAAAVRKIARQAILPASRESLGGITVGDGLNVDAVGLLTLALAGNDGLVIKDGKLTFDSTKMNLDSINKLLATLRVKIWLKQDSIWYVDGKNGSDNNDGGSAPDKAFKTIQYAANYISDNFELGSHTATISVAAGIFEEDVILPKYSASTGIIRIVGAGKNATILNGAYFGLPGASRWAISDQTIRFVGRGSPHTVDYLYDGIRMLGGSEAYLSNVLFDLGSSNGSGAVTTRSAARSVGSNIIFFTGCSFAGSGPGSSAFLAAQQSGNIQINGDADFNGEVSVATLMVQTGGGFTFDTGTIGRVPVLSGTVSGPRAVCFLNGIIYTMGSGGQAAFPGTIDGGVSTGGQIA